MLQPIRCLLDRSLCFRPERKLAGLDWARPPPHLHQRINRALQGTHNNPVENAIRPIALGRRNGLFTGSERAGRRAAAIQSLLATAQLNGLEPDAWLNETLEKLPTWPYRRIDELLPVKDSSTL